MLSADPTISVAERVDAACDRFESEWNADRKPRIDEFVAAAPESDRDELRQALLALELELQGRSEADTSVSRSSVRSGGKRVPEATIDQIRSTEPSASTVGRFEIRGVLGSGAFGKVYRAFDPQLGREVAVKVPLESTVKTEKERTQFLKEARSAANINHPNVCQVHEVGEANGRPYIVMALVRGQSLADTLKARKEPLPEKQAALIVRKIALALAAAHDSGIVHRDLKPANVMFDRERKDIVVMDFGLARGPRLGDARGTQSGVIMGTPAYMSPEQARGDSKGVGPSGDVFSLGVILYELLAGVRPFIGTATEVIGLILHVEPEPPSRHRPGIDPRLEAACMKAMAKDPAGRFATMKEFAAAVDAVLRSPAPAGPAAETARAGTTRREEDDQSTSTSNNLADVFAALSDDRKQTRAETAAAVEAAIAKHRTPRWVFLLVGLLFVGGMAALAGVVFFTRSDKVKVDLTVIINDVDLKDKSLTFFLNEEPISADTLAKPVELKPGVHIFTVKRGKEIVKRVEIRVEGGRNPGIKVEDITPPKAESPTPTNPTKDDLARWQGRWKCVGEKSRGRDWSAEELKAAGRVLIIEGDKYRVERTLGGTLGVYDGTFRLDASKSPKHFDFEGTGPAGAQIRLSGVYEFVDGRLRFIYRNFLSNAQQPRATWTDEKQPSVVWLEFERIPSEDGFVSLFNGKDLTGWQTEDGSPVTRGWVIRDRSIVRVKTTAPPSAIRETMRETLWTTARFGDYELELEFQTEGNSGVLLRTDDPKDGMQTGIEVQIHVPSSTLDKSSVGAFFGLRAPSKQNVRAGEWNTMRITARGGKLTVVINGETVNEMNLDDWTEAGKNPDRTPNTHTSAIKDLRRVGHIGLQAHTGQVSYRNIRIKPFVEEGFVLLFNGKDLTGWKTHDSQPGNWKVVDGVIVCGSDGTGPTHLYSARDDYKDFHFRMDVRVKDGSTGAMYRAPFGPTLGIKKEWVAGYNAKFDATRRGGIILDMDPALHRLREVDVKDGEWAKFEIIARGNRHIVKLNGETTADYTDPDSRYRSGHIVLQKHGTKAEVAFRNIEIKELAID